MSWLLCIVETLCFCVRGRQAQHRTFCWVLHYSLSTNALGEQH